MQKSLRILANQTHQCIKRVISHEKWGLSQNMFGLTFKYQYQNTSVICHINKEKKHNHSQQMKKMHMIKFITFMIKLSENLGQKGPFSIRYRVTTPTAKIILDSKTKCFPPVFHQFQFPTKLSPGRPNVLSHHMSLPLY